MNIPKLIALGYRARSGKDTVADYLVARYGYTRIAFGDKLKEVVSVLVGEDAFDTEFKTSTTRLGLSGGQALQQIGVKLREIDKDIWIKASGIEAALASGQYVVVPDCRFINEAEYINSLRGLLVRIDRPGLPEDFHVSETEGARIGWHAVIDNEGSIESLQHDIVDMLQVLSSLNAH